MHKPNALRRVLPAEPQTDLLFEDSALPVLPLPRSAEAVSDPAGWQLGYDHALHHVALPAAHLHPASPLFQGFHAALQTGTSPRQREVAAGTRSWLALRLQAWQEGLPFEDQLLTPHYLRQLRRSHCPVTRAALHDELNHPQQRTWARLRQDLGYAAGHLVQLGRTAALALAGRTAHQLQATAERLAQQGGSEAGLDDAAWARLAALVRLVTPQDGRLDPLPVLPPNRLRLLNPQQALQAWVGRQLALSGWAARGTALHDALPSVPARQAAHALWAALAPHALRLPQHDGVELLWRLEDLWCEARVQRRWVELLQTLRGVDLEALLLKLPAPAGCHVEHHAEEGATEGWVELH
ncbi:hypothetical protein [Inhella sp.]|uniref:hypothetical protein n=1 Tax=Inhella sp. TaxID=1921806 RepID=UPI0035B0FD07